MTYTLQEQYTSKNQVAGADANRVWNRGARKVSSITIHHWGNKGQQFDTVRDFLCTNNVPTSAHYVVQDGLVACIVSPDDCAFHAGNAEGNTNSIGIECRPEATDGDYATVAELIAYLRGIYGDIPLRPHNYWYATACPGDYNLSRLDALARGGTISVQSATIQTEQDWLDMATKQEVTEALMDALNHPEPDGEGGTLSVYGLLRIIKPMVHDVPRALLDTKIPRGGGEFPGDTTPRAVFAYADQMHIESLRASALAAHGDGVSADKIIETVRAALAAGIKVDATVKVGE